MYSQIYKIKDKHLIVNDIYIKTQIYTNQRKDTQIGMRMCTE